MPTLAYTVHVHDDAGNVHVFERGTIPPDWAAARIGNPIAWESGHAVPDAAIVPPAPAVADDGDEDSGEPDGTLPKQAGPDASRAKWAAYAEANGVAVAEDWKRADIIAACEQAGVPVA